MRNRKHGITLRQPATHWQDGLPSGNGTVGAIVYGNIHDELVLLNHEALWLRTPKRDIPSVSEHLLELRRLFVEGRYQEASKFLYTKMQEKGYEAQAIDPYHPAFDLGIEMETRQPFSFYRRSLDFQTGEVTVEWREAETTFKRRLFVSRMDDVVVMSISGDRPRTVTCDISLFPHAHAGIGGKNSRQSIKLPDLPLSFERSAEDGWLTIIGRYDDGNEFGGLARVIVKGGSLTTSEERTFVKDANEVVIIIKLFANEKSEDALPRLKAELSALLADYSKLLKRHAFLHRQLFQRVQLDIEGGGKRRLSADELLMQAYDGNVEPALFEKMFDYGRYLLISSSRPGGLPANLQGVWNGSYFPAWESDYHNDWNIQMNYWQALPGNLAETTLPYFDYYESFLEDYRRNAGMLFGCGGILAPVAQSTHGVMYAGRPLGKWVGVWLNWTAGAGWLAQLFYDYWLFTGDREFLANRAVPFMKEVALFYEDFLFEDETGKWTFSPSHSPENIPANPDAARVQVNSTMDAAVAKELLSNLCVACEELGIEEDGVLRWRAMLEKMPEYQVNEDGAIKEWIHPDLLDNYNHVHMAHTYPLFPGLEIMPESDPALCEAIRVAVDKRFEFGLRDFSCESFTHAACVYARLGDGERALECLESLVRACVLPNLFTCVNDWRGQGLSFFDYVTGYDGWCQPFQIDGNLGFSAAVLEMIVYSKPGLVKLLPALPGTWMKGKIEGVQCRGGIEVSVEWDLQKGWTRATLLSRSEQTITLKFPAILKSLKCEPADAAISDSDFGTIYRTLKLPAGVKITVTAGLWK